MTAPAEGLASHGIREADSCFWPRGAKANRTGFSGFRSLTRTGAFPCARCAAGRLAGAGFGRRVRPLRLSECAAACASSGAIFG